MALEDLVLTWLKGNATVIGAMSGALVAFAAVLQLVVVGPMNQRFDAQDKRIDDLRAEMNQRFDAQDKRLDLLTKEVSELRRLTVSIIERVSRNEGQIDFLREQLQTVDAPAP